MVMIAMMANKVIADSDNLLTIVGTTAATVNLLRLVLCEKSSPSLFSLSFVS